MARLLKLVTHRSISAKLPVMTAASAISMVLLAVTFLLTARAELIAERTQKAHAVAMASGAWQATRRRVGRDDRGRGEGPVRRRRRRHLVRGPHQLRIHLRHGNRALRREWRQSGADRQGHVWPHRFRTACRSRPDCSTSPDSRARARCNTGRPGQRHDPTDEARLCPGFRPLAPDDRLRPGHDGHRRDVRGLPSAGARR